MAAKLVKKVERAKPAENEEDAAACEREEIVREAVGSLPDEERQVVELYHFMGRSPVDIAEELKLSGRVVDRRLRFAAVKLRRLLAEYANKSYQIPLSPDLQSCPICTSQRRAEAELIISSKEERETWRRVMRELRDKLSIHIRTPQTLLGHVRHHLLAESQTALPQKLQRKVNREVDREVGKEDTAKPTPAEKSA